MKNADTHIITLIQSIPDNEPLTMHQLECQTGMNYRTIRKYLDLIVEIQEARKVVRERVGMRVFVKKG